MKKNRYYFTLPANYPLTCYIDNFLTLPISRHKNPQIFLILSDVIYITVNDQKYTLHKDDIIVINPFEAYSIHGDGGVVCVVEINFSLFHPANIIDIPRQFDCNSSINPTEDYSPLRELISKLAYSSANHTKFSPILFESLSHSLLYVLTANYGVSVSVDENNSYFERIEQAIEYVDIHYAEKITLNSMAEMLYITPQHLARIFRETLEVGFIEYVKSIRTSHAAKDLYDFNATIEDIALNNGFPNARSFSSAFKSIYGLLPSIYRDGLMKDSSTTINDDFDDKAYHKLFSYISESQVKELTPRKNTTTIRQPLISINSKGTPLPDTPSNIIAIETAKELLFAFNQKLLIEVVKNIGIKYVHFHNFFDDSMLMYMENNFGEAVYSFSNVDRIFDFLLSINIRPMLELSYSPTILSESPPQNHHQAIKNRPLPKNIKKWNTLIEKLMTHLENRYGRKEIEKWSFWFWNQPDNSHSPFYIEDTDSFFTFYKETYRTIKKISPNIRIGTPSFMCETLTNPENFNKFAEFYKKENCVPDFINFNFYSIEFGEQSTEIKNIFYLKYTPDDSFLKKQIAIIKKNAKQYQWNVSSFYMQEWNYFLGSDQLSDTLFRANYVLKNILENIDSLDGFAQWTLSDFSEEVQTPEYTFCGRFGLYTKNGIKKSTYYAYEFINKLGNRLMAKGNGYFVTRRGQDIQIILYNYVHYNDLYCRRTTFEFDPYADRYSQFETAPTLDFTLPLTGLNNTEYELKETIINHEHGSSYDKWISSGQIDLKSEDEINYIKSISIPFMKKERLAIKDSSINIHRELEPLAIHFIELKPM